MVTAEGLRSQRVLDSGEQVGWASAVAINQGGGEGARGWPGTFSTSAERGVCKHG